jgi:hypothetical protein
MYILNLSHAYIITGRLKPGTLQTEGIRTHDSEAAAMTTPITSLYILQTPIEIMNTV